MGYKLNDPCLEKAFEDERIFVLMTRDVHAPKAVLEWIRLSFFTQPDEKLREAFECALEMKNRFTEITERRARKAMDEKKQRTA